MGAVVIVKWLVLGWEGDHQCRESLLRYPASLLVSPPLSLLPSISALALKSIQVGLPEKSWRRKESGSWRDESMGGEMVEKYPTHTFH